MARDYLREFRGRVRATHDSTGTTCHWTSSDELIDDTLVTNQRGPCDCPSHRVDGALCSPHKCLRCASTGEVLQIATPAEAEYGPMLMRLSEALEVIEETVRVGNEIIRSLRRLSGQTLKEALSDSTLTTAMRGHVAPERPLVKRILQLELSRRPSIALITGGCACECLANKRSRISRERSYIKSLIEESTKQSNELEQTQKNGEATFSNTIGRVLTDSVALLEAVVSGKVEESLTAVRDLYSYYSANVSEGGLIYLFYKGVQAAGTLKREAMLGVIYHDQQLLALTCQPRTGTPSTVFLPPAPMGGTPLIPEGGPTITPLPGGGTIVINPEGTTIVVNPDGTIIVVPGRPTVPAPATQPTPAPVVPGITEESGAQLRDCRLFPKYLTSSVTGGPSRGRIELRLTSETVSASGDRATADGYEVRFSLDENGRGSDSAATSMPEFLFENYCRQEFTFVLKVGHIIFTESDTPILSDVKELTIPLYSCGRKQSISGNISFTYTEGGMDKTGSIFVLVDVDSRCE